MCTAAKKTMNVKGITTEKQQDALEYRWFVKLLDHSCVVKQQLPVTVQKTGVKKSNWLCTWLDDPNSRGPF